MHAWRHVRGEIVDKEEKERRKKRNWHSKSEKNTSHPVITIQEITTDAWTSCDAEEEGTI
jgi:hypothetical protein